MGACQSTMNETNAQQEAALYNIRNNSEELERAKQVIDNLNKSVANLEGELKQVNKQLDKERQRRSEETDKYNRANSKTNKIKAEKLELEKKMLEIAAVNGQQLSVNHNEQLNDDNTEKEFGKQQSPINIMSSVHHHCTQHAPQEHYENNPLKFTYPTKVKNCTIMNNGHTVQVNIDQSNKCLLHINGKTFQLAQFHFHCPSEHTIDGKQYEMEMHLVHVSEQSELAVLGFIFTVQKKYNKPKLQLSKSRAHLVLAQEATGNKTSGNKLGDALRVMQESQDDEESDDMETDDEWDEQKESQNNNNKKRKQKDNDFLKQFFDQLPNGKTEKDIPLKCDLTFDTLFENSSDNFSKNVKTNEIDIDMEIFEYQGSLTTPPYSEGVQWLVSHRTHYISQGQLRTLSACWNNENNARPVQEYFGRTVSLRNKSSLRVV